MSSTVFQLKIEVEKVTGVPPYSQLLLCNGQELKWISFTNFDSLDLSSFYTVYICKRVSPTFWEKKSEKKDDICGKMNNENFGRDFNSAFTRNVSSVLITDPDQNCRKANSS